jgi:hypothetical protein
MKKANKNKKEALKTTKNSLRIEIDDSYEKDQKRSR